MTDRTQYQQHSERHPLLDNNAGGDHGHHLQQPHRGPTTPTSSRSRFWTLALGPLIVLGIAGSWTGSSQFARSAYSPTFDAPFFNVWFSTMCLLPVFPLYCAIRLLGRLWCQSSHQETEPVSNTFSFQDEYLRGVAELVVPAPPSTQGTPPPHPLGAALLRWFGRPERPVWQLARFVLPFCMLWVLANYLYVKALKVSSSTDVTAIFSATPALVYVLSWLLLREPLSASRLVAVAVTIAGVVLVAVSEKLSGVSPEGAICTVLASACAATYKVLLKLCAPTATLRAIALHLSMLAVLSTAFLWPVWLILQHTHKESFAFDTVPWRFVAGGAGLGCVFNSLINFGIALTYPLFISIGTVLGIPVNAVVDRLVHHDSFGAQKIAGCCLVTVGFAILMYDRQTGARN